MATLQEQLNEQWKAAMRSGDTQRRDTLSTLRAAIKSAEINARSAESSGPIDDAATLQVIEREAKKRRDAIEEYQKVGRADRAEAEQKELAILQEFLPQQLSEAELETIVQNAISESGAKGPNDIGRAMQAVLPLVKGRADGKVVNGIVRRILSN